MESIIQPGMRLTGDVVMVGGGSLTGFGLSSDFDAHVYLLDGGDALALVDCGMGTKRGMEQVLARVAGAGVDPAGIQFLFLTHFHTDHAGGAARYRERLALQVAIGRDAQPALESGDHRATAFAAARDAGVFPADYEYPPCPVDDPLDDGDVRTVGRLTVRYIAGITNDSAVSGISPAAAAYAGGAAWTMISPTITIAK